jgi:hypothetical protein
LSVRAKHAYFAYLQDSCIEDCALWVSEQIRSADVAPLVLAFFSTTSQSKEKSYWEKWHVPIRMVGATEQRCSEETIRNRLWAIISLCSERRDNVPSHPTDPATPWFQFELTPPGSVSIFGTILSWRRNIFG